MEKMKIRWTIPTNTEYYAPEDYEGIEEDIQNLTTNEEELIRRYVEIHYPEAELTVDLVPETVSMTNRPRVDGGNDDILYELWSLVNRMLNTDGSHSPDFDIDEFISEYKNPETEG